MNEKQDGGPAFPVPYPGHFDQPGGMSLRDWFAGQALIGLVSQGESISKMERGATLSEICAKAAYILADNMLKVRQP